jgi:hypothetical protein
MTVTADTIATALGRDTYSTLEDAQWSMWIADALMLIEARLGDTAALDQNRLDYVVREAVRMHVLHPDNATQVSVSVDDASTSRTYRSGKGRVTILEEWWALLATEEEDSGAFVLDMISASSAHLDWCSYSLGALYCSCGVDIAGTPIYELGGWV